MCVYVCACVRAVVSHHRRFLSNTHTRETHGRQASDVTVVIETAGLVWIGPQPLTEGELVYASLCCLCFFHFSLVSSVCFVMNLMTKLSHTDAHINKVTFFFRFMIQDVQTWTKGGAFNAHFMKNP